MFSIHKYLRKKYTTARGRIQIAFSSLEAAASFGITTRQSIRALACSAEKIKKACELMKPAKTTRIQKVSAGFKFGARSQENGNQTRD